MSRRRNLLILVGILAILTAFLMAAYWPSTLPQVLGKDFAQLKEVQIHLSHVRNNSPSRDLTLSPDDPATGDLLALLEGQRYRPVYHNPWGAISGHPTALDYAIYGVFVFQGEDGGVSVPFYFDGYREVAPSARATAWTPLSSRPCWTFCWPSPTPRRDPRARPFPAGLSGRGGHNDEETEKVACPWRGGPGSRAFGLGILAQNLCPDGGRGL